MQSVLDKLPDRARVAIIRLRSLGDCVLTTPAIEILKRSRPDLRIAAVVEDRFAPVFESNPDVETLLGLSVQELRSWNPRLCLNLHGGPRSSMLTALSAARWRAGFDHFPHPFIYNVKIPRAQKILQVDRVVHTAEHLASAMFFLGAKKTEIPRAKLFASINRSSPAHAVIHPFASQTSKTWPADRFLEIADYLQKDCGLLPIFIGAAGDNLASFQKYRTVSGAPLAEIKSLLAAATLFAGNDSGPAHMAAAFGLPVVVIFGDSDREVWRPWKVASELLFDERGIASVQVQQVIDALARLRVHA